MVKALNATGLLLGLLGYVSAGQPSPLETPFSFGAAFGTNMVLQQAPAKAAVYGYLSSGATAVKVTVSSGGSELYSVDASLDTTLHQPFGAEGGYGPLPCDSCPPYNMTPFNAANKPMPAWKALLRPTKAGGNYTITASCTGCSGNVTQTITNVAFGDMWYCSGQSNMWLPLSSSFSRNETVASIMAGKYNNIRLMAGTSGDPVYADGKKGGSGRVFTSADYGGAEGTNPWMTAKMSIATGSSSGGGGTYPLFKFGATCWYFAQRLSELGIDVPIGIADTAIGGQRIEEYMYNASSSIGKCSERSGENIPWWDGHLFATQVSPFVDMTVKGWTWYQGENNMGSTMGNSNADVGYSCEQRELVRGWRQVWSETPGTTDPQAPFGIVTLASSGGEGNLGMGPMHLAQTAGHGVLPAPAGTGMENTFLAQAYDLDDEWAEGLGPCFAQGFNASSPHHNCCGKHANASLCTPEWQKKCAPACAAIANTPSHGGIHPRSKKPVGDRLGTAAFNVVYGGKKAYTGPTLAGCALTPTTLTIKFNETLLRGDNILLQKYAGSNYTPYHPGYGDPAWHGGSQLWVQTNASNFCVETQRINMSDPISEVYCPTWAGGQGKAVTRPGNTLVKTRLHTGKVVMRPMRFHNDTCAAAGFDPRTCKDWKQTPEQFQFDQAWINLPIMHVGEAPGTVTVDLSSLEGQIPTAVRYAWGETDCCDLSDPDLYVTHGCVANCPIMSSSALPANPFMAKIVGGKCECVAPQVCDEAVAISPGDSAVVV